MDKTPVDWEEFEAQAVLIQRLIADQLTSPESPHYITRLTEPANLIKFNVDSPLIEPPVSSFSSQTESCKAQAFHLKSAEVQDLRSPLKNVTNANCNNSTPEKQKSESLPCSCPTSAEFKEFLLQIAEVSLVSQDSVDDSLKDDMLPGSEKMRARKGTYDVNSEGAKTELGEACKSITRGRIGTYDATPSSPLLASLINHIGDDKKDDNVFAVDTKTEPGEACKSITRGRIGTYDAAPSSPLRASLLNPIGDDKKDNNAFAEERTCVVKPVRLLIPPSLASCSLDDSDTVSSSSDESVEEDQLEEPIPDSELLVVIDKVPSTKFSAKRKKKSKLTGSTVKSHVSSTATSRADDGATAIHVSVDKTKPAGLDGNDICKESLVATASSGDGSVQGVNDCLLAVQEANIQSAVDGSTVCELANITSVAIKSDNKANPVKNSGGSVVPSSRLIPKQAKAPGTVQQNVDQKPPSKMTKMNVPAKRSSLGQPSQAKAAVDTSERRSFGATAPTIKPTLLKPGRLQPKLVAKRPSLGTSGTKEESEAPGSDAMRPPDSILSKTVTKLQPAVSKLSQRNSKLHPPLQTSETKASAQTSDVSQTKETKVTAVSRLSLLPPKPSIGRCLPPPPKYIAKPAGESTKTVPEPPKAAPESTRTANVQIKAPLTATRTLRLVRPGFSKAPQPGTISAASSNSSLNESEKDVEEVVNKRHADAKQSAPDEGSTKAISQLKRKGPAPVKAIFQPSCPQTEGSRTVTKEKNDTSRLSTKGEQPDLSKTVTKVKPEDGKRTVTLSSENGSSANAKVEIQFTPMKSEKVFNPRRLSDVFQNALSPNSANSDIKGKTSKIPTPRSSRFSSHSSTGSNASFSFRKPSDFESPMPGRKDSTETSLSAFKPKRALVRYTPDVEPRRQSMWSPVKKKPLTDEDMAYLCTKKLRPGVEGSL